MNTIMGVNATRAAGFPTARLKLAELTSTLGAGVIGAGVGLLLANYLHDFVVPILGLGLLMHAWGMADKHAIEARVGDARPRWATVLYWFCWLALLAVAAYAAIRAFDVV